MKFYYTIRHKIEDNIILTLPSPYVIEDYAVSLMLQFVKEQKSVQALPDGEYIVNLYREVMPKDEKCGVAGYFIKNSNHIRIIE